MERETTGWDSVEQLKPLTDLLTKIISAAYSVRKRFCISKDCIISFYAFPTRCSCMFSRLNLSSYIRYHRKSIYLPTFWIASNSKIYLSSQAPQWHVLSMGLSCKNSSFVLKTKNARDSNFRGLHIQAIAMGPTHFSRGRWTLAQGRIRKVCKILEWLLHIVYLWSRWLKSCKFNSLVSCVR